MFSKREKNYAWFLSMFGRKEKEPKIQKIKLIKIKTKKKDLFLEKLFFKFYFRVDFIMCLAKHKDKNVQPKYPLSFFLLQKGTKHFIMEWLCPL
jgi:hypothetical protein